MANQVLYGGFRRLGPFALDPSSIVKNKAELEYYLTHSQTAYEGQQIIVTNDPDPVNNGAYTVHFEVVENSDGTTSVVKAPRQSASIQQVIQEIEKEAIRIETEVIQPLKTSVEEKITVINKVIGVSEDGTSAENNLITRITEIETLLNINGDELSTDAIKDLNDEIDRIESDFKTEIETLKSMVGNEELSKVFATKEDIKNFATSDQLNKVETDLEDLKNVVDALEGGGESSSLKELDDKLDKLLDDLGVIEGELYDFDAHIVNIVAKSDLYTNLNQRIQSNTDTLNQHTTDITNLNTLVNANILNIASLTTRISSLETSVDNKISELKRELTNLLNEKLTEVEGKLNDLKYSVEQTKTFDFSSVLENLPLCKITGLKVFVNTTDPSTEPIPKIILSNENDEKELVGSFMRNGEEISEIDISSVSTSEFELNPENYIIYNSINSIRIEDYGNATGKIMVRFIETK